MRDRAADRRLMRYLHGELPAEEVRELRAELARDPALQARLAELHRLWQGLQASPPTPAPFGYVPKLQRLAETKRVETATSAIGFGTAPPWVRAMAAAALVAGVALGVGLGRMPSGTKTGAGLEVAAVPSGSASAVDGVGPRVSVEPSIGARVSGDAEEAVPSVAPSPSRTTGAPSPEPEEMAAERGDSGVAADAEAESVEAMLAADGVSLGGSTTLAEEYWQALEGTGGDGNGGEGDAGW